MNSPNGQQKTPENVRALAAKTLHKLHTQNTTLTLLLSPYKQRSDFPLLQEIAYGTCRWFFLLEWVLSQLMDKPLRGKDSDVKILLLVGLYQLRFMSLPDYAVINETVTASAKLKKPWSRGLINGVLRNYLRQSESIDAALSSAPKFTALSMPQWLIDRIGHDWPTHAASYFDAANQRPPMVLRVNEAQTHTADYLTALAEKGIAAKAGRFAATAIYLERATDVKELPGFDRGLVSVQDESSQLIPELMQLAPGQKVLDSCAAPGGKTCHILESQPKLDSVTAIELVAGRATKIQENLTRLKLSAEVKVADANALDSWWDGQAFDRILLDAPCSATGILRRHPDIKILRTPENIAELNILQYQLLSSIWPCLKPGGLLLYTTCSVLKAENELIIAKFLKSTPDAKYESITADWGVECEVGRQLLPATVDGPDGFFFSLLRKVL